MVSRRREQVQRTEMAEGPARGFGADPKTRRWGEEVYLGAEPKMHCL